MRGARARVRMPRTPCISFGARPSQLTLAMTAVAWQARYFAFSGRTVDCGPGYPPGEAVLLRRGGWFLLSPPDNSRLVVNRGPSRFKARVTTQLFGRLTGYGGESTRCVSPFSTQRRFGSAALCRPFEHRRAWFVLGCRGCHLVYPIGRVAAGGGARAPGRMRAGRSWRASVASDQCRRGLGAALQDHE